MVVSKILLKNADSFLARFGYKLVKQKQPSVKCLNDDPRELNYMFRLPNITLQLPMEQGVGMRFYSLATNSYHPYVLTLRHADASQDKEQSAFKILRKFADHAVCKSANDYLGLNDEKVFDENSHPYEFTYPWSINSAEKQKKMYVDNLRLENELNGLKSDEHMEGAGVSDAKIRIEVSRLFKLKTSIMQEGYKSQDKGIGCFVLLYNGQWKWYVEGGQHRAAVLAFLGYDKVPVHVKCIIRRDEVKVWPNVLSGLYNEQAALKVFDRMFNSEPPPVAKEWVHYVDELSREPILV